MFIRHCIIALFLVLTAAVATAGEIHLAIEAGDLSSVKALVGADAELVNQKDDNRDRSLPLHSAAGAGQVDIIK